MKIEIVYASYHHNNTEKVVLELERRLKEYEHGVVLNNVTKELVIHDETFDFTIFASGIYYFGFHKNIYKYLESLQKQVRGPAFVFYTAGALTDNFLNKIIKKVEDKGYDVVGTHGMLGFDTYGPYKLVGGLNKGRPDKEDISGLFYILESSMESFKWEVWY